MSIEANTFDFVERCQRHTTPKALLDDLLTCVREFGFEYLILSGVPVGNQSLAPLIELNGWPADWLGRYVAQNHASVDGVCLHAARSTQPFFWHDVPPPLRDTAGSKRVAGEATEFGIRSGYVVPMSSRKHWQAAISLASPAARCDISEREQSAVNLMSAFAVAAVEGMLFPEDAEHLLTEREREVLTWAAAGKTAWEISRILSISVSAVEKHLLTVRQKYGVGTTIQAAIHAIRRREICP